MGSGGKQAVSLYTLCGFNFWTVLCIVYSKDFYLQWKTWAFHITPTLCWRGWIIGTVALALDSPVLPPRPSPARRAPRASPPPPSLPNSGSGGYFSRLRNTSRPLAFESPRGWKTEKHVPPAWSSAAAEQTAQRSPPIAAGRTLWEGCSSHAFLTEISFLPISIFKYFEVKNVFGYV